LTIDRIKLFGQSSPSLRPMEIKDVPPQLLATFKMLLTPEQKTALARPRPRVNGLMPREAAMQQRVNDLVRLVSDPGLNDDQRRENARKARQKLQDYSNYLRAQDQLPDALYQTMGVPDSYMRDNKDSTRTALSRVETALRTVKKYEQ